MRFGLANLVFGDMESCVGHGGESLETELNKGAIVRCRCSMAILSASEKRGLGPDFGNDSILFIMYWLKRVFCGKLEP